MSVPDEGWLDSLYAMSDRELLSEALKEMIWALRRSEASKDNFMAIENLQAIAAAVSCRPEDRKAQSSLPPNPLERE